MISHSRARSAELKCLFRDNWRNCPPFVFSYRCDTSHRKWQITYDPEYDTFHIRSLWTNHDCYEHWFGVFDLLVRPDALMDDQPFDEWLLSWAGFVQLDSLQVEELL